MEARVGHTTNIHSNIHSKVTRYLWQLHYSKASQMNMPRGCHTSSGTDLVVQQHGGHVQSTSKPLRILTMLEFLSVHYVSMMCVNMYREGDKIVKQEFSNQETHPSIHPHKALRHDSNLMTPGKQSTAKYRVYGLFTLYHM